MEIWADSHDIRHLLERETYDTDLPKHDAAMRIILLTLPNHDRAYAPSPEASQGPEPLHRIYMSSPIWMWLVNYLHLHLHIYLPCGYWYIHTQLYIHTQTKTPALAPKITRGLALRASEGEELQVLGRHSRLNQVSNDTHTAAGPSSHYDQHLQPSPASWSAAH